MIIFDFHRYSLSSVDGHTTFYSKKKFILRATITEKDTSHTPYCCAGLLLAFEGILPFGRSVFDACLFLLRPGVSLVILAGVPVSGTLLNGDELW